MKWKIVPEDLTDEMAEGIALAGNCCGGVAASIWRAALSAAPDPLEDETLREQVARAIHAADDMEESYEEMKTFFDALADAAIAAMKG